MPTRKLWHRPNAPVPARWIVTVAAVCTVGAAACGPIGEVGEGGAQDGGPAAGAAPAAGGNGDIAMARATWDTGFMQAAIYRQLLTELGHTVSDPSEATLDADIFYPALAEGEYDFWVNGWFPLHATYLERELVTGQEVSLPVSPVGLQAGDGALQGYLVDARTAQEMSLTSMTDFTDPAVAEAFDADGDGKADLVGCNDGWGCNTAISEHLTTLEWGANVEQQVGDYSELIEGVVDNIASGEPALFYTWTPNWTIDVLVPGEDVVWLESPPLPRVEGSTEVEVLPGCAAPQPCQLGWVANDIRVVANDDFLETHPAARRLFELVEIPPADIAAQNARMHAAGDYAESDIIQDAADWIERNRDDVDMWLEEAQSAG